MSGRNKQEQIIPFGGKLKGKGGRRGKEPETEMERVKRAMQVEGGRLQSRVWRREREGKREGRVREGAGGGEEGMLTDVEGSEGQEQNDKFLRRLKS